jgi:hypothetical protein
MELIECDERGCKANDVLVNTHFKANRRKQRKGSLTVAKKDGWLIQGTEAWCPRHAGDERKRQLAKSFDAGYFEYR